MTTPDALATELLDLAVQVLTDLDAHHAPGFVLPLVSGGYSVGPDARADLAFTLGLLHDAGIESIAGHEVAPIALEIVRTLDGHYTHSFYSYRAAETLLRLGGLDANTRLRAWTDADRDNVALACDSSSMLTMLDEGKLPGNYAVVLTRCEIARRALGVLPDENRLYELLAMLTSKFGGLEAGWWDDFGGANYDMYTPDVYLFAEPFADELGTSWVMGLRSVLADLADVATPGGAISWGRSTGALGVVMNIELGATAVGRDLTDDPAGWLGRAALATRSIRGWFEQGLVTAHQHKMTMSYRGPARRMQMTLDLLGKLVQAAHELRKADPSIEAAGPAESYADADRLVRFESDRVTGVWTHRGGGIDFVMPFVGGMWGDYTASPRWPGTFEVPVENHRHVSWLPVIHADDTVRMTHGLPTAVTHKPGGVSVIYDDFRTLDFGANDDGKEAIEGSRHVSYRVEGRSLVAEERLVIKRDPATIDAVAVQIPETAGRPLHVEFTSSDPHTVATIDTSGMREHRSFWNEHPRVHELVIEPSRAIELGWKVTPALRVASSALGHWYDDSLYLPMGDRVVRGSAVFIADDVAALAEYDVVHIHWPEWFAGTDPARSHQLIANLREAGVTILWTQHNRIPHHFPEAREVYEIWTAAADVVVHHSDYGRAVMEADYAYGAHTRHAVIPHGHWGERLEPLRPAGGRDEAAEALGLPPAAIRLGIVGAPRRQKDVQMVLDAVHASDRDDIQLCVWSLGDETVPDDPRIIAAPYELSDHTVYAQRLFALDALVMPFTEGMLTTGTMGDAIGIGVPTLASDWGYLREALGDGGIYYGSSTADLTACLNALTSDQLAAAAAAAVVQRATCDWSVIAESTLALLDEVVAAR